MLLKNSAFCGGVLNDIKKYTFYIVQQAKFLKLVKPQNVQVYSVLKTNYEEKLKQFENTFKHVSIYYYKTILTFIQICIIDLKLMEDVNVENRENIKKKYYCM